MKNIAIQVIGILLIIILIRYVFLNIKIEQRNWQGVIRQKNQYSCGAAALAMIFESNKIDVPLKSIEDSIIKPLEGCSLLDLKNFSENKGLGSFGWNLTFNELSRIHMPSIIHFDKSHFVVLDSIINDSIYVRDPLRGMVVIPKNKFLKKWDGNVLEFRK
jgi:ATP-binding cassette subfamily B protein